MQAATPKEKQMKVVPLTAAQQLQIAQLKATLDTSQAATQVARKALNAALNTAAGVVSTPGRPAPFSRVSLTDDGKSVISQ